MIHSGTHLKFFVSIEADGFLMSRDPWTIEIRDSFHRLALSIDKGECYRDTLGNWYFNMNAVPTGSYIAHTKISIPDEDFDPQQYMVITDKTHVVDVGLHSCQKPYRPCHCECETEGIITTITRVWSKSIDGADYLADKDGNYIYTSDGRRIQFIVQNEINDANMGKVQLNMTGEQFKQLIEGNDPNGQINTLPEALAAMQGISDDGSTIEESMTSNLTDEDMEKWFDDDPTNDDPEE